MGEMLIFDYMNKDEVSSHIEVNLETKEVSCINYTSVRAHQAFGNRPANIESVNLLFRQRCFSEQRPDKEQLLRMLNLKQYNPYDIVRVTKGMMNHDHNWIQFADEPKMKYGELRAELSGEG